MKKIFETIIIGAGPAGLRAGMELEDCLILEQKKEIGKPVQCAEAITKKGLEKAGILPDLNWISTVINTTQIILPNKKSIILPQAKAYILDRVGFEKSLAQKCKAKILLKKRVVDFEKENTLWKVMTEKGEKFFSKYLIGADGPLSIVRKKVFQQKIEVFPCFQYLVRLEKKIDTSIMKMYFDRERFFGYAWIFPKSEYTANIGLGGKNNLKEKFKDFMENTVKKEYGDFELLEPRCGFGPYPSGAKIKLVKDNAVLVGDAGGLISPIFGGGMENALISGREAAFSILSKNLQLYETKIKSMPAFSEDLLLAQKILYSLDNRVLNEIGEILEKKGGDILALKNPLCFLKFLSKPNLRKNLSKLFQLFLIYQRHKKSYFLKS
jgi:digeranylgeranylglycerophospholipid reductase